MVEQSSKKVVTLSHQVAVGRKDNEPALQKR